MASIGYIEFEANADGDIAMVVTVNDQLLVKSRSVESVAREVERRGLGALQLADGFSFTLPSDSETMTAAAQADLKYPLTVLKLVAACAWLAGVA